MQQNWQLARRVIQFQPLRHSISLSLSPNSHIFNILKFETFFNATIIKQKLRRRSSMPVRAIVNKNKNPLP